MQAFSSATRPRVCALCLQHASRSATRAIWKNTWDHYYSNHRVGFSTARIAD
jgi:fructosamine-3-kinase